MPATPLQLDIMAKHYCIAAIWADCPEGTTPRETRKALRQAREACARFVDAAGPLFDQLLVCFDYGRHPDCGTIERQCAAAGHDLYLTSCGHGVGFWDRRELKADGLGDALSALCRGADPETYFYRGWLYFQHFDYLDSLKEQAK